MSAPAIVDGLLDAARAVLTGTAGRADITARCEAIAQEIRGLSFDERLVVGEFVASVAAALEAGPVRL